MTLDNDPFAALPQFGAMNGFQNGFMPQPMAGASGFAGYMPGFGQPQMPHGMFGNGFNRTLKLGQSMIPFHLGGPLGALLSAVF